LVNDETTVLSVFITQNVYIYIYIYVASAWNCDMKIIAINTSSLGYFSFMRVFVLDLTPMPFLAEQRGRVSLHTPWGWAHSSRSLELWTLPGNPETSASVLAAG